LLGIIFFIFPAFAATKAGNSQNVILTVSDIHFDPFLYCEQKKLAPCPLISQLRLASPKDWAAIFKKYKTKAPAYKEDTSYALLNTSLAEIKKIADEEKPRFVFILGDELGHEYRGYYKQYAKDKSYKGFQSFVKKTLAFLTLQFSQTFPTNDVYSLIGNNDEYLGDYVTEVGNSFYKDAGGLWSSLIKDPATRVSMEKQFSKAGYYAVDVPHLPSLRLIVLNSVIFSYKVEGRRVDKAAKDELQWFHQQLEDAAQKNQKVFILMHIPPSYDVYIARDIKLFTLFNLWHKEYIQTFLKDLNDYSRIIVSVFASHLHTDWQQVDEMQNGDKISMFGTPSISPIFGNDPAFKLYFYDPSNLHVIDYTTYTYPLWPGNAWISSHVEQ